MSADVVSRSVLKITMQIDAHLNNKLKRLALGINLECTVPEISVLIDTQQVQESRFQSHNWTNGKTRTPSDLNGSAFPDRMHVVLVRQLQRSCLKGDHHRSKQGGLPQVVRIPTDLLRGVDRVVHPSIRRYRRGYSATVAGHTLLYKSANQCDVLQVVSQHYRGPSLSRAEFHGIPSTGKRNVSGLQNRIPLRLGHAGLGTGKRHDLSHDSSSSCWPGITSTSRHASNASTPAK